MHQYDKTVFWEKFRVTQKRALIPAVPIVAHRTARNLRPVTGPSLFRERISLSHADGSLAGCWLWQGRPALEMLEEKANSRASCCDAYLARIRRATAADAIAEPVWLIQHLHMVGIPQRQFDGSGRRLLEETEAIYRRPIPATCSTSRQRRSELWNQRNSPLGKLFCANRGRRIGHGVAARAIFWKGNHIPDGIGACKQRT